MFADMESFLRLFRTADFDCSRSGSLRMVFGIRFRLLFAMKSGLQCRGESVILSSIY
jgi:hypothetical protein